MHSSLTLGISQAACGESTRDCPCCAELVSVLRRWVIKLTPFEHRANGSSNEPEEMSLRKELG